MATKSNVVEDHIFHQYFDWLKYLGGREIPSDPLVEIFAQDSEVCHMTASASYYQDEAWMTLLLGNLYCPCIGIPIWTIVCCWPCNILNAVAHGHYHELANARHLILRQHSLVYRVDQSQPRQISFMECCEAKITNFDHGIEFVFSLDDPIQVVKGKANVDCDLTDTFANVLYKDVVVASIYATDESIDEFIEKFHVQVRITKESTKLNDVDQHQREIHETIRDFEKTLISTKFPSFSEIKDEKTRSGMTEARAKEMYDAFKNKLALVGVAVDIDSAGAGAPAPIAAIVRNIQPGETVVVLKPDFLIDYSVSDVVDVLSRLARVDGTIMMAADDETFLELGVKSNVERKRILGWVMKQKHHPLDRV